MNALAATGRPSAASDLWPAIVEQATRYAPLAEQAARAERISLMGAGFHGMHAAAWLRREGFQPVAFFDNGRDKQGTRSAGLPVLGVEAYDAAAHGFVLITARHVVPTLAAQLSALGIPHLSYDAFFVARHLSFFEAFRRDWLADARSREVLDHLLLAMLTGSAEPCSAISEPDQYFALPRFRAGREERFVDAGAHDGDSVAAFLEAHNGSFARIWAFEPTAEPFDALRAAIASLATRWGFEPDRITPVRAGVGEMSGHLTLAPSRGQPRSNQLIAEADADGEAVPVVHLDRLLAGEPVTFLKADIEGMELAMLKGARATIARDRPKLAISLYHKMEDWLDIPALIRAIDPSYRFALRHHSPSLMETVLYAWAE